MRFSKLSTVFSVLIIAFAIHVKAQKNPNVVIIYADDLGYGDVGAQNPNSQIPTPNMDALAKNGITFTDGHSTSAVCTPSRYSMLTGRYAWRTRLEKGVLGGYSPSLIDHGTSTLATIMSKAGYKTALIGKWHLGLDWKKRTADDFMLPSESFASLAQSDVTNIDYAKEIDGGPVDHGFDYSYIIPASLDIPPYVFIENKHITESITGKIDKARAMGHDERGVVWRKGAIAKDFDMRKVLPIFTEKVVRFIEANAEKPFFVHMPLTAPHTPWLPSKEAQGKSNAGRYGDFVVDVDNSVGKVLTVLKKHKLLENTIVILTSDNGAHWKESDKQEFPHLANGQFSGMKSDALEGGHRVPFIVSWPKKIKGAHVNNNMVSQADIFATLADLTGYQMKYNEGVDSFSFIHALDGNQDKVIRKNLVNHSVSGVFAVRMGNMKYIESKKSGGWTKRAAVATDGQLYDLSKDPKELHNLYAKDNKITEKMKRELQRIQLENRSRFE